MSIIYTSPFSHHCNVYAKCVSKRLQPDIILYGPSHMNIYFINVYIILYFFEFNFFNTRWKSFSFTVRSCINQVQAKTIFFILFSRWTRFGWKVFLDYIIYFTNIQTPVKTINCQNLKKNIVFSYREQLYYNTII